MDTPNTPGGSSVPLAAHSAVKSHWKEEFIPSFNSLTSSKKIYQREIDTFCALTRITLYKDLGLQP